MSDEPADGLTAEALLTRYACPAEPYTVEIDAETSVVMRPIVRAGEIVRLEMLARRMADHERDGTLSPEWRPYLPLGAEVLRGIVLLEQAIVSPKMSHLDLARLASLNGLLVLRLVSEVSNRMGAHGAAILSEEVAERGEG